MLAYGTPADYAVCDGVTADCANAAGTKYSVPIGFTSTNGVYEATVPFDEGICLGCIAMLTNTLQKDFVAGTVTLHTSCSKYPLSSDCQKDPYMSPLMDSYRECSGIRIEYNSGDFLYEKAVEISGLEQSTKGFADTALARLIQL
jgi:hypothetical protein